MPKISARVRFQALEWLQNGAGLSVAEGSDFKAKVEAERQAKRYWWEP